MGSVTVSAARLSSMLGNRNQSPVDLAGLDLSVDPSLCVQADSDLTLEDLVGLGKFFKRPWSYLLIDEPEVLDTVGQDNRSLRNQKFPPSVALLDQIHAVVEMLSTAADLFPETTFEVPAGVTSSTTAKTAGRVIREFLGVSERDQLQAKDDFSALRVWIDAVHRRGVYVSQRNLGDDTVLCFQPG